MNFSTKALSATLIFCALATGVDRATAQSAKNPFAAWNDGDYDRIVSLLDRAKTYVQRYEGRSFVMPEDYPDYFAHNPQAPLADEFRKAYGATQMSNNCYSFAVNSPQDHVPFAKISPGAAAGIFFASGNIGRGDYVARLATADGLKPLKEQEAPATGFYRVALVIAPGEDFHWYREGADGSWYHKMGHMAVSNRDASGQIIKDPRRADRDYSKSGNDNYSVFYGFFAVPDAGINLNSKASHHQRLMNFAGGVLTPLSPY